MNLVEYRAKKTMLNEERRRFDFIKAGCQQCVHFDFGKCKANGGAIVPPEFVAVVEQCDDWLYDEVPF